MEFKSLNLEIKADVENNIIEGYGAYFNNVDSYGDIIEKGAFSKSIIENKSRIKILWQHNPNEPIGRPIEMYEDDKGLYIKAKISNTELGRKAMELMRDGVISEMSIGYEVEKKDFKGNNRVIKEVKLWEISAVTFAANPQAKILSVKNKENLELDLNNAIIKIEELKDLLNSLKPEQKLQEENEEEILQTILKELRNNK